MKTINLAKLILLSLLVPVVCFGVIKANYKFDGSCNDNTGSYGCTEQGTTYTTAGKNASSTLFDGSNDYVDVGIGNNFTTSNNVGTICFQLFPLDCTPPDGEGVILIKGDSGSLLSFADIEIMDISAVSVYSRIMYKTKSGASDAVVATASDGSCYENKWTFYCFSGNNSDNTKIYVNGDATTTNNAYAVNPGSSFFDSGNTWKFGTFFRSGTSPPSNVYSGKMDNLRFETTTLTPAQIKTLYQNQRGDF